jgi:hypothetical protein
MSEQCVYREVRSNLDKYGTFTREIHRSYLRHLKLLKP